VLGFEEARSRLGVAHVEATGNPLRLSVRAKIPTRRENAGILIRFAKTVLVFRRLGRSANDHHATAKALPNLVETYNMIWQTGKLGRSGYGGEEYYRCSVESRHLKVLEFIEDMSGAYAVSDIANLSRRGNDPRGISYDRVPAILVPYPFCYG